MVAKVFILRGSVCTFHSGQVLSLGYERGGRILLTKAFLSFTHLKGLGTKLTRLYKLAVYPKANWDLSVLSIVIGGFRNLERGVQPLACEAHPKILSCHAHFWSHESKLNFSKQVSSQTSGDGKELIHECVTGPGCCCCMPLLHNHLIDSCSYVRKNILLAAKGRPPYTPPQIRH